MHDLAWRLNESNEKVRESIKKLNELTNSFNKFDDITDREVKVANHMMGLTTYMASPQRNHHVIHGINLYAKDPASNHAYPYNPKRYFQELEETNDDDILNDILHFAFDKGWSGNLPFKSSGLKDLWWYVFDGNIEYEFEDGTEYMSFSLEDICNDVNFCKAYFGESTESTALTFKQYNGNYFSNGRTGETFFHFGEEAAKYHFKELEEVVDKLGYLGRYLIYRFYASW